MSTFRKTEEAALSNVIRKTPKPPIDEADLAMQAALEGKECFPNNTPKAPRLSRLACLFPKGPSDVAGSEDY